MTTEEAERLSALRAEPRRDIRDELSVSLWKRGFAIAGFQPRLTVTATRQDSNVSFRDYDRVRSSVTFTRSF